MGCRPTQQGRHRERPRCTGAAIEAGLHILSLAQASPADAAAAAAAPHAQTGMSRAATPMDGRMLIVTSGPTTKAWHQMFLLITTRTSNVW